MAALALAPATHARAFGGLWSSAPLRQSALKVAFVDNPDDTISALIQLRYEGAAERLAWIIPVRGQPTLELSSNTVFDRLDAATSPQYWVESAVEGECQPEASEPEPEPEVGVRPAVTVVDEGELGPYAQTTLALDTSAADPIAAALAWFEAEGYTLTERHSQMLASYLKDGYQLLALEVRPTSDARALRPLLLTYTAERPAIPIRAAGAAAGDDTTLQVWVIGPSQAVPINYASLVLNDALIDWLTGRTYPALTLPSGGAGPFGTYFSRPKNYDAVVSAAANEAGGRAFVTELAGPASKIRDAVWSPLDADTFTTISTQPYADGIDAVINANGYYAAWDGWKEVILAAARLPAEVSVDAFSRDPDKYRGMVHVDTERFLSLLESRVVKPVADTAAIFYRAPYVTRLFTTLSADEMTVDPEFDYNFELGQVNNTHVAKQVVRCSSELQRDAAPWRMRLPQGGAIQGEGQEWPAAIGDMPANLKVVELSTRGSGKVVEDNSSELGKLLASNERDQAPVLRPPQNGLRIGGSQQLVSPSTVKAPNPFAKAEPKRQADGGCGVAHTGSGLSCWLLAALLFVLHRRNRLRWSMLWLILGVLAAASCSEESEPVHSGAAGGGAPLSPEAMTREQLRDPETCKGCHPIHYKEWSSSMHAYAARDPVFLAMNKRGQRETGGELGDFCIKCHAPMAVVDKTTKDGLDLEHLPDLNRGVSCYFCHNVASIEGDHNAKLKLANDSTLRGPIKDPVQPSAHRAEFSDIFDEPNPLSSAMCGSCHDIVLPSGVHLERTFEEYRNGLFSKTADGEPPAFASCFGCHMPGREGYAADPSQGGQVRTVHEHLWPGIDVALIDHPNREAMRSAVEDCQLGGLSVSFFKLEVTPPNVFTFEFETNAGHNQPSGASQDRRMWLEFSAYDENGALIEEASSGRIEDGELEDKPSDHPDYDPNLLLFRDRIFDAQGKQVHMFWEAEPSKAYPEGYESRALPVASTTYIEGRHVVIKQYRASTKDGRLPARVTARLRIRPIGVDVLEDLVKSGDLDRAIAERMPTFTFGAQIDWTPEDGMQKSVAAEVNKDCATYRCLLEPGSQGCE
ncbi:MAG TPA: DUF2330 domain-containing protein [Polyangiales bacterium]|nr:DUF2330 domain-containing protein [Polyangiales bacterium]